MSRISSSVGLITGHQTPWSLAAAALHDAVLAADIGARLDRVPGS